MKFVHSIVFAVFTALGPLADAADGTAGAATNLAATFGGLPLTFIQNGGQVDPQVSYYSHGADAAIYFTPGGVTLAILDAQSNLLAHPHLKRGLTVDAVTHRRQRWALKLDFVGANINIQPQRENEMTGVASYFKGPRAMWKTGLKTYEQITYPNLWPGIDATFSGNEGHLKYTYFVQPGSNPSQIQLSCRGATMVATNTDSQLELHTPLGVVYDEKPFAYQEINGLRVPVEVEYALEAAPDSGNGNHQIAKRFHFNVGPYDTTRPLIIDPVVLVYARTLSGNGSTRGLGMAVDPKGNAYVCGPTSATSFPVTAGPDLTFQGSDDAYVGKLNTNGTAWTYLGFIAGEGFQEAFGVAVDKNGAAYVCGYTTSDETSFPVTVGPTLHYQGGQIGPGVDAFIAKVDPTGTNLDYCGYIGGSGDEAAENVAVDATGHAYVTGYTTSTETSFPVVVGPDLTQNGRWDTFIAKVKSDGSGFDYCGYIGGANDDAQVFYDQFGNFAAISGGSVAVDTNGAAYVCSFTASDQTTFPNGQGFGKKLAGFNQTYNGGAHDAFVVKVKPDGSGPVYATYLGGAGDDGAYGIGVDASGNAYVGGLTGSSEATFPVRGGPDLHFHGPAPSATEDGVDAFVAKLDPTGTQLIWCGYIGGPGDDDVTMLRVDPAGTVYVIGQTESSQTNFPVVNGPGFVLQGDRDAFVAKLKQNPTDPVVTNNFVYCGYIGGPGTDAGFDIGFDGPGNAYCTGDLFISPYGTTGGAFVAKVGNGAQFLPQDDFDTAATITNLPFNGTLDISWATAAPDDPVPSGIGRLLQTLWYQFTPTTDMLVVMDVNCPPPPPPYAGEAEVVVYSGARGALTQVAEGLGGRVVFPMKAGVTYHFMIGIPAALSGQIGSAQFSLKQYAPQIANDDFNSAKVITALPFADQFDVSLTTTAWDDPVVNGLQCLRTVWYDFTPGRDMFVGGDTGCPTAYRIIIFTGTRGALTLVAGGQFGLGIMGIHLSAGITYHVLLCYGNLYGLNLCTPFSVNFRLRELFPPSNDDVAHATVISSLPFVDTNTLVDATWAAIDPTVPVYNHVDNIWYAFTTTQDMSIEADTLGSDYYVPIAAFSGSTGALTNVSLSFSCDTYYFPNRIGFTARAGVTYYLSLIDFGCPQPGRTQLNVRNAVGAPSLNDDFSNATVIATLPFTSTNTLLYATAAPDDPYPYPYDRRGTVWYAFTPTNDVAVDISTAGSVVNPVLGVYTGTRGSLNAAPVGTGCQYRYRNIYGDDVTTQISLEAKAGVTYYLLVGDQQFNCPQPDDFVLTVKERINYPSNDDFDHATVIATLPFADQLDVANATRCSDDTPYTCTDCPKQFNERSVWYSFTPATNMRLDLSTAGSDYDTVLWVFTGSRADIGAGTLESYVGCNNDGCCDNQCGFSEGSNFPPCYGQSFTSRLQFEALAGVTYHFMIGAGGYRGCLTNSDLVFTVFGNPPPVSASVDPLAILGKDGSVTVSGTMACTGPNSANTGIFVVQPPGCDIFFGSCDEGFPTNSVAISCPGQTAWNLTIPTNNMIGTPLAAGPADVWVTDSTLVNPDICGGQSYDSSFYRVPVTIVPGAGASLASSFNGTAIAAGTTLWFNSVLNPQGLSTNHPVTIRFVNQQITGLPTGTVALPDTVITFDPKAKCVSTRMVNGIRMTTAPVSGVSGNTFLSGLEVPCNGLPGNLKNIVWSGAFLVDTPGVALNWFWSATVYKSFSPDQNQLGLKSTDDIKQDCAYPGNSDLAGTPENFKKFVTGGARGNGGQNYTGALTDGQHIAQ